MYEIFYLDVYFATNFLMDLVSLAVGALSASRRVPFWKLCLAAAFGASFSAVLALLRVEGIWMLCASVLAFGVMLMICFGVREKRRLIKPALFSFGCAVFLGGAAQMISYYVAPRGSETKLGFAVLLESVLCAAGIYSLWGSYMSRKLDTAVVSLSISFCGRSEHYFGLVDSGLLLRDPDEGRPVLLLKAEYAEPLLSRDFICRMAKGELSGSEKLICVPIRTVGGEKSLYAFLPERVQVISMGKRRKKREERGVLVALDFSGGGFGGCPCLVPLSVL